jgi:CHAT domain-containing protein
MGCAGIALFALVGFALISGGINFVFDLLLWIPSKYFGVFLSAVVLASVGAASAIAIGRVPRLATVQQGIVVSAQSVLAVVGFVFFILLTESTVGRQTAQWAAYTVIGVPFAGLFGAIFDGRWLALVALTGMFFAGWLSMAGGESIESAARSRAPIWIARVLLLTVTLAGAALYIRTGIGPSQITERDVNSGYGTDAPYGASRARQASLGIDLREMGYRVKLSFLGPKHSESIVSARHLYERMHGHGLYARSLPYIDSAIQMSEEKYGHLSLESLRHQTAKLKVQLLNGRYDETSELVEQILQQLEAETGGPPSLKCGFKLELASVFASVGYQFDVSRLMEGVVTDPQCPISEDVIYRLPAYIAYARGLIWDERYQEAMAVLLVAANEAAGTIPEESALGIELWETFADLSIRVGDPVETLILEETIWDLVHEVTAKNDPRRVTSTARLAAALVNAGFYSDALATIESSLPALESMFGIHSPTVVAARLVQIRGLRSAGAVQESVDLSKNVLADTVVHFGDLHLLTNQAKRELVASLYAAERFAELKREGARVLANWPSTEVDGATALRFRDQAVEIAKYVAMSRAWSEELPAGFALAEAVKSETSRFRGASVSDPSSSASLEIAAIEEQIASAYAFPELRAHLERRRSELLSTIGNVGLDPEPYQFFKEDLEVLPEILRVLGDEEAYASYLLTSDGLGVLFLVRDDGIQAYEIDVSYDEIQEFHEFLMNPGGEQPGGQYDGSILTARLFPFLNDSELHDFPRKLVVSSDLWLKHLPFDALQFGNAPLIRKSAISITSHSNSWLKVRRSGRERSEPARLLVVGNPSYGVESKVTGSEAETNMPPLAAAYRSALDTAASGGATWASLPGSEKEIDGLEAIWHPEKIEVISGRDAHETRVVEALDSPRQRFDYVLFSTHGFSNLIEPEVSALVLAPRPNGSEAASQLSAAKIRRLDLGAQLVFLSACDTNSRPISSLSGPAGLPRAFSEAGAMHTVVTLWPVLDDVAPEISIRFFEAVLKGEQYTDALADAKRQVSAMKGKEHPYFWAGFMLYEGG